MIQISGDFCFLFMLFNVFDLLNYVLIYELSIRNMKI
jgi:hypothetical protein